MNPAFWKIKPAKERLARRAYVVSQNTLQVDATAGSVTGVNVPLYKGNALIYGHLTDNSNTPLANIIFDANDNNNQFAAKGYTDANGNYTVAVLAITNDSWYCNANSAVPLENYILNNFSNTNVFIGSRIQEDFVALPITAHISGQVLDKTGNPVSDVSLFATTLNNGYESQNQQTDNSGYYSLGVASGLIVRRFQSRWRERFGYRRVRGSLRTLRGDHSAHEQRAEPHGLSPWHRAPQPAATHVSTHFGFTIKGAPNVTYTVQASTNLATTNWANLFSLTLTNNSFPVVDPNATNTMRFYRVLKG